MCRIDVVSYISNGQRVSYEIPRYCGKSDGRFTCLTAERRYAGDPAVPELMSSLSQASPISDSFPPTPNGEPSVVEYRPSRVRSQSGTYRVIKPEFTITIGGGKQKGKERPKYREKEKIYRPRSLEESSSLSDVAVIGHRLGSSAPSADAFPPISNALSPLSASPRVREAVPMDNYLTTTREPSSSTSPHSHRKHRIRRSVEIKQPALPPPGGPSPTDSLFPSMSSSRPEKVVVVNNDRRAREREPLARQDENRAYPSRYEYGTERRYTEDRLEKPRKSDGKRPRSSRDSGLDRDYLYQKELEQQGKERIQAEFRVNEERASFIRSAETINKLAEDRIRYRTRPLPVQPGHPSYSLETSMITTTPRLGEPFSPTTASSSSAVAGASILRSPIKPMGRTMKEQGIEILAQERARRKAQELHEKLEGLDLDDDRDRYSGSSKDSSRRR